MEYTVVVREIDRASNRIQNGQGLIRGERSCPAETSVESLALEILHHKVGNSPIPDIDAEVRDVDDVWVFELAQGRRFRTEPDEKSAVGGSCRSNQFYGEDPVERLVASTVDNTHTPLT